MIDARDEGRIGNDLHSCNDITDMTFFFKDDNTKGVFINGIK